MAHDPDYAEWSAWQGVTVPGIGHALVFPDGLGAVTVSVGISRQSEVVVELDRERARLVARWLTAAAGAAAAGRTWPQWEGAHLDDGGHVLVKADQSQVLVSARRRSAGSDIGLVVGLPAEPVAEFAGWVDTAAEYLRPGRRQPVTVSTTEPPF